MNLFGGKWKLKFVTKGAVLNKTFLLNQFNLFN